MTEQNFITLKRGNEVIAEQVPYAPSTPPYWDIHDKNPRSGKAELCQGGDCVPIEIVELCDSGEWLIVRGENGNLAGIAWGDCIIFDEILRNHKGEWVTEITDLFSGYDPRAHVRTIFSGKFHGNC